MCRRSWVCLQHHATVVTSNSVTVCGSKFPPAVSKHYQHQHCAIPKTIQQYAVPTIPAVVISKVLLPQSNINAELVSHSKFLSDSSPGLPKYNNLHRIQFTVAFHMDISSSGTCPVCPNIEIQHYILFC
jgi:hypothetical protein